MTTSFQLIDIVMLIGICQGIFLALTLQRITNNNRTANRILSLLIVFATVMLIGRFVYFRYLSYWVFQWSLLVDSLVFLFGPLIYIYLRRLLFKDNSNYSLARIHFLPFLIMILLAVFYLVSYSPEAYYNLMFTGNLLLYFDVISAVMIVFNFGYLVGSFLLIKKYHSEERETFSFKQTPVTYLYYFLFSLAVCLLAWTFAFIDSTFFDGDFAFFGYTSIWVAIPIFIYVIGYFSLKQPELFRIQLEDTPKEKRARLSDADAALLKEKLDSLMINERLFLESNLTLSEIAETLQTSTNNISWLLNNIYKTTFYDFVNGHRVNEFLKRIENNEHLKHTLLALSFDVGFNSKSTFNKAFKAAMRQTPSDYIKKYRAA